MERNLLNDTDWILRCPKVQINMSSIDTESKLTLFANKNAETESYGICQINKLTPFGYIDIRRKFTVS